MLKPAENDLLCRVGPETPMGALLRRYWLPVALSTELEPGGRPVRTRLVAENLVAFRDPHGGLGLLDEYCPHRGASLGLARNEESGLRCLYHGWKVAASGKILETPPEPPESSFKDRVRHIAYPVREAGGVVWGYLGPGPAPPFRTFDWMRWPAANSVLFKARVDCNWVQAVEGTIDSAHLTYLHYDLMFGGDVEKLGQISTDGSPRLEIDNTGYGFRYAALRKSVDGSQLVRVSHFVAPCFGIFAGPMGWPSAQAYVPADDHHCVLYFVICRHDGPIDDQVRARLAQSLGLVAGVDLDDDYRRVRRRENHWLQDRAAMLRGETFTGIAGVNSEDQAVQESMGPIYDRSREHLGTSDVAVIRMRRLMIDAAQRLRDGEEHIGLDDPHTGELRGFEQVAPAGVAWQSLEPVDD